MTFQRIEAVAAALVAALAFAGLGGYVLFTHKDTAGLWVGVPCILMALAIVVPVPLKAGGARRARRARCGDAYRHCGHAPRRRQTDRPSSRH